MEPTREVPLTRGYVAIVDAADYEAVRDAGAWHAAVSARGNVYARRNVRGPAGKRTTQYMHKFLTGHAITDHRNGDGLDNRRANLRLATAAENGRNRGRQANNTSGFKGVSWKPRNRMWQANIRFRGRLTHLGLFPTPEAAARAYDTAARELHGTFAHTNFLEET